MTPAMVKYIARKKLYGGRNDETRQADTGSDSITGSHVRLHETTVLATEPDAAEQTEELSEEQKAEQAAYEMKVESNDWKNWPQGPGTYGEAAIVMEVGTGAILYAKNIDSHNIRPALPRC